MDNLIFSNFLNIKYKLIVLVFNFFISEKRFTISNKLLRIKKNNLVLFLD